MTVIVGYENTQGVYIGADSFVTSAWSRQEIGQPKVFQITYHGNSVSESETCIIGLTGTVRGSQLMQFKLKDAISRLQKPTESDTEYLSTVFVDAVRQVFKDNGVASNDKNVEDAENIFLLGYRGKLYCIGSNYCVLRVKESFQATGCGYEYALGAMEALKSINENITPEKLITTAIRAAAKFDPYVKTPIDILFQDRKTREINQVSPTSTHTSERSE